MTRKPNGHYAKGTCGNLGGRPREPERRFNNGQEREDFLEATEEKLSIPFNGKIRKMRAMPFIYRQLVVKAAKGDTRCMLAVINLRHDIIAKITSEALDALETLIETEKDLRVNHENFTDKTIELMHQMREGLSKTFGRF